MCSWYTTATCFIVIGKHRPKKLNIHKVFQLSPLGQRWKVPDDTPMNRGYYQSLHAHEKKTIDVTFFSPKLELNLLREQNLKSEIFHAVKEKRTQSSYLFYTKKVLLHF